MAIDSRLDVPFVAQSRGFAINRKHVTSCSNLERVPSSRGVRHVSTSSLVLTRDGDRDGILAAVNDAFDINDDCYGPFFIHSLR